MKALVTLLALPFAGAMVWTAITFYTVADHAQTSSIRSKLMQEDRSFTVYLPEGYRRDGSDNKTYDVLYTLDGEGFRHGYLVAAMANGLADIGAIPKIIIVAIDGQDKRLRDFIPENTRSTHGDDLSGKAGVFYSFLDEELIPEIENAFKTSGQKLIAGHSSGGLFTLYAFTLHPEKFSAYFAMSPSLWENDKSVELFKQTLVKNPALDNFLYLNLGSEGDEMRSPFMQAEEILQNNSPLKLRSKVRYYALPHSLIMVPGYLEALYSYYQVQEG